jgi:type IV secretory pathway component VirB8
MTNEFTADQTRRWDEWQRANAASARRTDVIFRVVGIVLFAAVALALAVAIAGMGA